MSVTDNGGTSNGGVAAVTNTFTVTVTSVNDAPTLAVVSNPAAVLEDAGLQTVNLGGISAGGGESQVLTVTASSSNTGLIPNPSVTYTSPSATGSLSYTPVANASGTATITVIVTDNGGTSNGGVAAVTNTFTVTVTSVNDAPSFTKGVNLAVNEDAGTQTVAAWATAISSGPANESGQAVDFIVSNNNNSLFSVQPAIAANGTLTYTPAANSNGVAAVTAQIHDNGGTANGGVDTSAAQTFTITVNGVNDAPTLTTIATLTGATEDTAFTITYAALAAVTDESDVDGDALSFRVESVSSGTLSKGGVAVVAGTSLLSAGESLVWTPSTNATGTVSAFALAAWDGTANSSPAVPVKVSVSAANDAPTLTVAGSTNVVEGSLLEFTATATDPDLPAQTLTFSLDNPPAGAAIDPASGRFTWTPGESLGGTATNVTVRVTDNGDPSKSAAETIVVTVVDTNGPPVLGAIGNKSVVEGNLLTFTATATDADIPAQTLTFSLDAGAPSGANITAGGVFTWTPGEALGGTVPTITIRVTDNGNPSMSASETITISVLDTNSPPALAAVGNKSVVEGNLLTFTATATDPDIPAQTLTFSLDAGAPSGANITSGGVFTWTPGEALGGTAVNVTIRVTDSGIPSKSAAETITITVVDTNSPPVLAAIGNKSAVEGERLTFTATATDADLPTQTLTFSLDAGAPSGATITSGGVFSWTPGEALGGTAPTITIRVTDNGDPSKSAAETIVVTVLDTNSAPVLAAIGNKSVVEGNLLTFTATATDADIPAQTLTFSLDAGAPSGANITADGVFTWTPGEALGGTAPTITIR
ncbi:MAG: Ig-like domain-containing protein, partial [Verrucomicrobiota bacterium]